MGSFPLWSLCEDVRHVRFRLMSDVVGRGDAKAMATKQKVSRAITKKEMAYLLSRFFTMQVRRVVNGLVVSTFAEGATLP